ncbi:hypothetical protein INT47_010458, partial [Mucor saturninus]
SALIAAKKRLETSLKKYDIPTTDTPHSVDACDSGVLLLSLLQSRLHWTHSVFPRYKSDPLQQPKRTSNSRKKWPFMKWLGTGHLELGPHIFPNTTFYEAKRSTLLSSIAQAHGVTYEDHEAKLEFVDIVFELAEIPNERFIFPKEALVSLSVENGPIELHASFAIPSDTTDTFFSSPQEQLYACHDMDLPTPLLDILRDHPPPVDKSDNKVYEPVNIRITLLNQVTLDALEDNVYPPDKVKHSLTSKMKSFPRKKYVQYDLSQQSTDKSDVSELVKRAMTVPDITTGPIMAEKKRNEILNAIRLGKRPRDHKFEAELPKNKYQNNVAKEDGLLKCAYCSTRYTAMWQPGPAGHGTLCNSCGIQWKRKEILKGAPVISPHEEKRLLREKKEKERALELEREEELLQQKKQQQLQQQQQQQKKVSQKKEDTIHVASVKKTVPTTTIKKVKGESMKKTEETTVAVATAPSSVTPVTVATMVAPVTTATAATAATASTTGAATPSTTSGVVETSTQNSFFLYSQGGIPLPTLFISFGTTQTFSHPNCAVTLLDGHFHIRLCCMEGEQSLINLEKSDLVDAQFEISTQPTGGGGGGEEMGGPAREILTMTLSPLTRPLIIGNTTFTSQHITIQFLEKIDPSGGAVVKRILQRWLVTIPQSS